jgi:hypothetical protein
MCHFPLLLATLLLQYRFMVCLLLTSRKKYIKLSSLLSVCLKRLIPWYQKLIHGSLLKLHAKATCITLFIVIGVFCNTDNIMWKILNIQYECEE